MPRRNPQQKHQEVVHFKGLIAYNCESGPAEYLEGDREGPTCQQQKPLPARTPPQRESANSTKIKQHIQESKAKRTSGDELCEVAIGYRPTQKENEERTAEER